MSETAKQFVTLPVAAEMLAVSDKTLRRMIANGEITGYRLGRRSRILRIDTAELQALMQPVLPAAIAGSESHA